MGPKIGDPCNDTGFMILKDVRIPREHMLARFQSVAKDGTYVSNKLDPKLHYSTMMYARAAMMAGASTKLANACTIVTRYNAVRM